MEPDITESSQLQSSSQHPADIAEMYESLSPEERSALPGSLGDARLVEVITFLSPSSGLDLLRRCAESIQTVLLDRLPADDLVDILQEAGKARRTRLLQLLPDSKKKIARDLLDYPPDSAGGRMTTALAAIRPEMTIRAAIEQISSRSERSEVLSRIFVTDRSGHLLGKLRLRDLTFNRRSTHISDIMDSDTLSIDARDDQEEAVRLMSKYDLLALPVVDKNGRLVGVISHDDALEIQEQESTEDLERLSAIAGDSQESYLDTSILTHFRRRFGWVLFLGFVAIISGVIIYRFESLLQAYFVLAIYMPMVVAAGGNTGGQAATMVIRAMSLGEFPPAAVARVAWKEARVGMLIGGLLGIIVAAQIVLFLPIESDLPAGRSFVHIAVTVGLSLFIQIVTSTLVGATLPIAAKACKLDPAVVASPAITTFVDISGMLIYFGLALWLLGV